ncbi:MAG: hypothetical protein Q7T16_05925 [Candidatus Burarchaeum sp.]|nr:hypothetical protein [Candidatus Burarchaeum sp.]MDO8340165.1 hypothetical protein [Candidatus Burarchaeum sp.]
MAIDMSERWKIITLAVLAFSLLTFVNRPYLSLDSFQYASGLRAFESGQAPAAGSGQTFFYMLSSPLVGLTTFQYFGPLLGALSILLLYFALRHSFGSTPSFFACAILAASPAFTSFSSSGTYLPSSLAFFLFSLGAYALLSSENKKAPVLALVGGLALAVAAFVSLDSLLLSGILALSLAAQALYDHLAKREAYLVAPALALAGVIAGLAVAGIPTLSSESSFNTVLFGLLALLPFALSALAVALLGLQKSEKGPHAFAACAILLSAIAAFFSPYAALFGAVLACAYGLSWALGEHEGQKAEMLFLGLQVFAVIFPLLYIYAFGEVRSFAFAIFVGAVAALALKLYEDNKGSFKVAVYLLALFALFLSLALGALLTQTQYKEAHADVAVALEWAAQNMPSGSVIAGFGLADQISYFAHGAALNDDALIARFLLTNATSSEFAQKGVDYLVVDARSFEDLSSLREASGENSVRMDAFSFGGLSRDQATGNIYAIFFSPDAQLLAPFDQQSGRLIGYTYTLRRATGESFEISSSRVLVLKYNDSEGLQTLDRIIYPGESHTTNLFKLYFGSVKGTEKVYPEGEGAVRIYKITG